MQVFKLFFQIARSRIKALAIYMTLYMTIILAFTFSANSNNEQNFTAKAMDVYVQDFDNSESSRALIEYMGSLHKVHREEMTESQLADNIYYRMIDYVLIIPEGYERKLSSMETKDLVTEECVSGSGAAVFASHQIEQFNKSVQLYIAGGYSVSDALDATKNAIGSLPEVETVRFSDGGSGNTTVFFFFQYLPYIFVLLLFVGMAPIFVLQNEKDNKARTDCSCVSAKSSSIQSFMAGGLFAFIVWVLFIVIAMVLFRGDFFNERVYLAVANSFVFIIFAVAITVLVSLFAPDDNMVNIMANVIGLSMSFLCGVFVPQSMLSARVLTVARFLPCYWYIANNNMLSGASAQVFDMKYFAQCVGIQLLFAAAVFAVAFSLSKTRARA